MPTSTVILLVAAVVVLLLLFWFISTGNRFVRGRIEVEKAFSNVDVWLANRYNTLTKMVDTLRDYTSYERDTLAQLVGLRTGGFAGDVQAAESAERKIREIERDIFVQLENYPQLKSSDMFAGLQRAIRDCEDNLQAAHRGYNAAVGSYNTSIAVFPASIVAGLRGLRPYALFGATETQRADVSVRL